MKTTRQKQYDRLKKITRPVMIIVDDPHLNMEDRTRILYPSGLCLYKKSNFFRYVNNIFIKNSKDFSGDWNARDKRLFETSCFSTRTNRDEFSSKRDRLNLIQTVKKMKRYDGRYLEIKAIIPL